jgi:hypothetical protein
MRSMYRSVHKICRIPLIATSAGLCYAIEPNRTQYEPVSLSGGSESDLVACRAKRPLI